MTNQEQYELICEKARKYDRLVLVLNKIKAEIAEHANRLTDSLYGDGLRHALYIIDQCSKAESEGNE